jgi:glycosyltransferase involved in cell wall biosynthesis
VRAGSARELARSIQVLTSDNALRLQYGANARRRIREKFNVERTVARTLDMYDELMGRPPSRSTGM